MQHAESFRDLVVYPQTRDGLIDELERIGRMLQSMMDKAGLFCGPSARCVREDTVEYFVHRSPITDHRSPLQLRLRRPFGVATGHTRKRSEV